MKLRTHLIILVIAALLPSLILAAIMLVYFNNQQRTAVEDGLVNTARALSLAVDRELETSISALQALGSSEHLERADFRQFYEQARRVLTTQKRWSTIILFDSSARQVFNLLRPFGSPLPKDPPVNPGVKNTIDLKRPFVSDLFVGRIPGEARIAVNVPVIRNGEVRYVLGVNFAPLTLINLIKEQNIPRDWLATIIDRNQVAIARTRDFEKFVGKPALPNFAAESKKTQEGVFRGLLYESAPVYSGFHRSELSGWTVVLSAPVSVVETPLQRSLMLAAVGGLALILLGSGLAVLFSRRITASIYTLSKTAKTLAGEDPAAAAAAASGSGRQIAEVTRVAQAIREATLSRIQAHQQIEDNLARLRALHQIDVAIGSSLDLDAVLTILLEKIDLFLPYPTASTIRLLNKSTGELEATACLGVDEAEWKGRSPMGAWVGASHKAFETKRPVFSRNAPEDPQTRDPDFARRQGWVSRLVVPLIAKEKPLGVLAIYTKEEREFSNDEIDSMIALADRAAIAIHNAQLYEEAKSERDKSHLLARLLLTAQEKERERIAHELHDDIGQQLTAIKLSLEAVEAKAPGDKKQGFKEVHGLVVDTMVKIRSMILDIRPPMLEHLGLLRTLQNHFDRYTAQNKIEVEFHHDGLQRRLGMGIEAAAYRIVQEALTNVARYAGVKKAVVRVQNTDRALMVEVSDRGKGFDAAAKMGSGKTLGLAGMRERVASLGGRFEVRSSPGSGAQVRVEIPLETSEEEHNT